MGSPAGSPSDPNDDGVAGPCGGADTTMPQCYNLHPITVPATGDNQTANVKVTWSTPSSDYDLELYLDKNKDGKLDSGDPQIGTSGQGATTEEEVGLANGEKKLEPGTKYLLKVVNFAA